MADETQAKLGKEKGPEQQVREVWRRYDVSKSATARWRIEARRAFNYYESSQRPPEVNRHDNVLYLVLNLTRSRVDTKVGILTSAKPKPELTGRGVEDTDAAEAYKDLLEYSADEDRYSSKLHDSVGDMCKCGLGLLEEVHNPDLRQMTSHGWAPGKLELSVADPMRLYPDPKNRSASFRGKTGPDWYIIESEEMIEDLKELYPSKRRQLEALAAEAQASESPENVAIDEDYELDIGHAEDDSGVEAKEATRLADRVVKVLTMWYKLRTPVDRVFTKDQDGALGIPPEPVAAETAKDDDGYEIVRSIEEKVMTRSVAGKVLLYDKPSPYKHGEWPHVFVSGTMFRDEPMPYGEIHNLFDAQDLFNKLNSVVIDNAIRNNNAGWKLEQGAMDPKEEERLHQDGSSPGFIAKVRMGRADGLDRLEPGNLPHGLWQIQQDLRVNFDEFSSLYQTQRGGMPYETSGKAIIALQRAADSALIHLQSNIEEAITDWGQRRLSNILQFYRYETAWRISDRVKEQDSFLATQFDQAEGQAQPTLHLYRMEQGNPEAKRLTEDFGRVEFDVRFRIGTDHERSRDQKMEEAKFLFEAGAVDDEYLLKEFEVEGRRTVLGRVRERNQALTIGKQVVEMMQADPMVGSLVKLVLQKPNIIIGALQSAGMDPEALAQTGLQGAGMPQMGGGPPQLPAAAMAG